jgi:hypothetical protein
MRRLTLALAIALPALIAAGPPSPTPPAPDRFLCPAVVEGEAVNVWAYLRTRDQQGRVMVHYFPSENPHLFDHRPRTPVAVRPGVTREADGSLNNGILLNDLHKGRQGMVTSDTEFGRKILESLHNLPVVDSKGRPIRPPTGDTGPIQEPPPAAKQVDLPLAQAQPPPDRRWYAVPAALALVAVAICAGNRAGKVATP